MGSKDTGRRAYVCVNGWVMYECVCAHISKWYVLWFSGQLAHECVCGKVGWCCVGVCMRMADSWYIGMDVCMWVGNVCLYKFGLLHGLCM